jgi:hypothetical protein
MSLEALVGVKITIFIWLPYSISNLHLTTVSLLQISLTNTVT